MAAYYNEYDAAAAAILVQQIADGVIAPVGDGASRSGQSTWERQTHHGEARGGQHRGPDGRNGTYWSDAERIVCHDGKARRAKPGLRLLVDGLPGRVDLWRVGGNAIVPEAAVEVIAALREVLDAERVRLTGVFA